MSNFHMGQIFGYGLDPIPPFGTMPLILFFKASLSEKRYLSANLVAVLVEVGL